MYGVKQRNLNTDPDAPRPVVIAIADNFPTPLEYLEVASISDRTPLPSKVVIRIRGTGEDDTPILWDDVVKKFIGGLRIAIQADGFTYFIGEMMQRDRMSQAMTVGLTFEDDKSLLSRIPVHGCMVWDGGDIKFRPSSNIVLNPGGLFNCVEVEQDGCKFAVPCFTPVAYKNGKENPAPAKAGEVGTPCPWTPERFLRHLLYRYTIWVPTEGYDGLETIPSSKIEWPESTLLFTEEEMKKKLPELSVPVTGDLQPRSIAGVMNRICEVAGVIGWRLNYKPDTWKSVVTFYSKTSPTVAASGKPTPATRDIVCQTSGVPSDANIAYDYHDSTDYSTLITRTWFEGQEFEIETGWMYDPEDEENTTLELPWTADEQTAFVAIINGDGTYAKVDDKLMDGEEGRLKVLCNTQAAVQLARQRYPLVFRALRLKKTGKIVTDIMKGYADTDYSLEKYLGHYIQTYRPINDQQVQGVFLEEETTKTETDTRYDPRIMLSEGPEDDNYHQISHADGLHITAQGLIFLDGLVENIDGQSDCVYSGSLAATPFAVVMKKVKINASVKHDTRLNNLATLKTIKDPNNVIPEIDKSWLNQKSGPSYYEQNEAWRQQHQVNSSPTQAEFMPLPDDTTEDKVPLNRIYRDEGADVLKASERSLKKLSRPARSASWKYISIQPFRAGDWIGNLKLVPNNTTIVINAPVSAATTTFGTTPNTEVQLEGF